MTKASFAPESDTDPSRSMTPFELWCKIEEKMDAREEAVKARHDAVLSILDDHSVRHEAHDERNDQQDKRLDLHQVRIDALGSIRASSLQMWLLVVLLFVLVLLRATIR